MESLQRILDLARTGLERQPTLALAIAGALVAVFLSIVLRPAGKESVAGTIYTQLCRGMWALLVTGLLAGAVVGWQSYLRRSLNDFRHSHGRLTETNLEAVRTIWGDEQVQPELGVSLHWEEEQTERIESEDLSKPAVLRKKTVRHHITANPFLTARHAVTLRQNARQKGSAVYAGYETDCHFQWLIRNPADRAVNGQFRFPLPSRSAMFDDLTVTLNGTNALARLRVENAALVLDQELAAGETVDLAVAFKSRGLEYWYFQVREAREVRDFELILELPDLPKSKLNYPEGCMTPTTIAATNGNRGSVLTYRLDRAICNKGMGVAMPKLAQPGESMSAVLAEAEKGWGLLFAGLVFGLTLTRARQSALMGVLLASAAALVYGLTGNLSDTVLGFWGSAAVVLLPALLLIAGLAWRLAGVWLAGLVVVFGALYPCLAGLDESRQTLYLNICAGLLLIGIVLWLRRVETNAAR